MTASERFYKTISGLRPDRIPSFPVAQMGGVNTLSFMNNTPDQSDLVPLLWTSSKLM